MLIKEVHIPPFEAFRALRDLKMPFIMSAIEGAKKYSIAGASPSIIIKSENNKTIVEGSDDKILGRYKDPFTAISKILKDHGNTVKGPFPFNSGFAGYLAYSLKDVIEPSKARGKRSGASLVPDCIIGYYDPVYVFDHGSGQGYLIAASGDKKRFEAFKDALKHKSVPVEPTQNAGRLASDTSKAEYIKAINKAKEYISSGDIYQINISQRLSVPWSGDGFSLFTRLSSAYPAPFGSFFDFGDFQLISNSPERLLKVKDGFAETAPIKGTRPRGKTPEEDIALIEELKKSKKERAEHVMIVDLERNDLGRISVPGTVEVTAFEKIETFRHLHHMVSTVRGRLIGGIDTPSALKAVFPGGSVTGAPKIRAMEIIDELEASPRGIYTGGIGWIDSTGDMDFSMAIRTAVYKSGVIHLNVGGGIVADSVPEAEYDETLLKAEDFLNVMGILSR